MAGCNVTITIAAGRYKTRGQAELEDATVDWSLIDQFLPLGHPSVTEIPLRPP